MNKKIVLVIFALVLKIVLVIFALGYDVLAQEAVPQSLSLSLKEAQDYALTHNRTILVSDLAVQKAEKAKWSSMATMLPHVDASGSYSSFLGYEINLGGMSIPMNSSGTFTGSITEAFSGVMLVATQLSKVAHSMSELSKESSELDVKANVTTSYYAVLIAEESKRILEQSSANLGKLSKSTQSMVSVGMAERTDADLITVQMQTMENTIRSAERNIELSYNSLRLLLGVDATTDITITDDLESLMEVNSVKSSIDTPFAIEQNINVQILDKNIELSQKQVSMQKWAYGPTISAYYQYNAKTYFGKDEGFNMTPPNTVGATLNIPIFSSMERLSKVRQAKIDLQTAELNKQDAMSGLLVQEKQLRFNIISALETYEVQKKNIDVYGEIFSKTSKKFEQGMASSIDLINISNNLLSAQSSYIQSLMELLTAHINLQKLLNDI